MPPSSPYSEGPLALPFQRPDPRCRTFHSDAIEKVISDITSRMKDPDLARLFENTFPSTTDTTVKFHTDGKKEKERTASGPWEGPQSFIIHGRHHRRMAAGQHEPAVAISAAGEEGPRAVHVDSGRH